MARSRIKLACCPFCGKRNFEVLNYSGDECDGGDGWAVKCRSCHAVGPGKFSDKVYAKHKWNERRGSAQSVIDKIRGIGP